PKLHRSPVMLVPLQNGTGQYNPREPASTVSWFFGLDRIGCVRLSHEERRPSKRIRVTQEEMVKDEKPKKG
ncbi:hypothetical protein Tco_0750044, partial [Tanacetum coccineum]